MMLRLMRLRAAVAAVVLNVVTITDIAEGDPTTTAARAAAAAAVPPPPIQGVQRSGDGDNVGGAPVRVGMLHHRIYQR